jgi:hypothetical protein
MYHDNEKIKILTEKVKRIREAKNPFNHIPLDRIFYSPTQHIKYEKEKD